MSRARRVYGFPLSDSDSNKLTGLTDSELDEMGDEMAGDKIEECEEALLNKCKEVWPNAQIFPVYLPGKKVEGIGIFLYGNWKGVWSPNPCPTAAVEKVKDIILSHHLDIQPVWCQLCETLY